MEAEMIEPIFLAFAEYTFPGGFVCGWEARFGEAAVTHCATQE
jgi:hypothetical protein